MSEIVVGSIVELKSGSPPMTVNKVDGDKIDVVWFTPEPGTDALYGPQWDSFSVDAVNLVA